VQLTNFAYLGVLAFISLGTIWLEFVMGAQVLRKAKRLVLSLTPVFIGLTLWDLYAIKEGHWFFNSNYGTQLDLYRLKNCYFLSSHLWQCSLVLKRFEQ
jgi:lycopene cyclase domain-containing protein